MSDDIDLPSPRTFLRENLRVLSCGICHRQPSADHILVQVTGSACQHVFGVDCIAQWATSGEPQAHTCPVCNSPLLRAKAEVAEGDGPEDESAWETVDESDNETVKDKSFMEEEKRQGASVAGAMVRDEEEGSHMSDMKLDNDSEDTVSGLEVDSEPHRVLEISEDDSDFEPDASLRKGRDGGPARRSKRLVSTSHRPSSDIGVFQIPQAELVAFVHTFWKKLWHVVETKVHATDEKIFEIGLSIFPEDGAALQASEHVREAMISIGRGMLSKHRRTRSYDADADIQQYVNGMIVTLTDVANAWMTTGLMF